MARNRWRRARSPGTHRLALADHAPQERGSQPRFQLRLEHVLAPEELSGGHRRICKCDLQGRLGEPLGAGVVDVAGAGVEVAGRQDRSDGISTLTGIPYCCISAATACVRWCIAALLPP